MRLKSLILLFLLGSQLAYSQNSLKKIKINKGISKEVYYIDSLNRKQGVFSIKYTTNASIDGFYKDDLKDSVWVYDVQHRSVIRGKYIKGKKDSLWTYYENNFLKSSIPYKEGVRNGLSKGYYPNGSISAFVPYINGKINGNRLSYYENGKIKIEANYSNNELDGDSKVYDAEGNLLLFIIFKRGTPFSLKYVGEPYSSVYKGNLNNGTGIFEYYMKREKTGDYFLKSHQEYKDGYINDTIVEYYDNGNIKFIGEYHNGFMVGNWCFFNFRVKDKYITKQYTIHDSITYDKTELFSVTPEKPELFKTDESVFENVNIKNFLQYEAKYLKYPIEENINGIQGKVYANFTVNENGELENINMNSATTVNFEKEARIMVENSPIWTPAFQDNIPVRLHYMLPIYFLMPPQ